MASRHLVLFAGQQQGKFFFIQMHQHYLCFPSCHLRRFISARNKCVLTVPIRRFVHCAISSSDISSITLNNSVSRCGCESCLTSIITEASFSRWITKSSGETVRSGTAIARRFSSSELSRRDSRRQKARRRLRK